MRPPKVPQSERIRVRLYQESGGVSFTGDSSAAVCLASAVADLIDARYRQPSRLGELLARDALLEPLADQAAELGVGGVECAAAALHEGEASP
jgi:hypothetical protein